AFGLGRWIALTQGPTNAITWLRSLPLAIQTNQPVPLILSDCQIAIRDWKGLQGLVTKSDWGEVEHYRLAAESLAARSLGQSAASGAAWRKALRLSAHRLDRLSRLVEVAGIWGWPEERLEA